ncbi:MAG: hypothetical protein ACYC2P_08020 [Paludibacteraceae bacterium]
MRRNFTLVRSTQKCSNEVLTAQKMEPRESSIDKIIKFAASYRVEKVSKDEFIGYYLN